jgi:hypothetical protein
MKLPLIVTGTEYVVWRSPLCNFLQPPIIWRMAYSGMLRRVALLRTDISEEPSASFIRLTKIGELGTTPAATSNRRTLRRNSKSDLSSVQRSLQRSVYKQKQTPWPLVREWTIPTERPPLVDEIYCQLLRIEGCRVVRAADPLWSLISVF